MGQTGHALIGPSGELLSIDDAFCDILRLDRESVHGRLVLDVTAPADRHECAIAIQHLRDTGRPFVITKRFLRDDGSLVWVKNTVSMTADPKGVETIMATIEPVEQVEEHSPAVLLGAAHYLITMRRDRASVCDRRLFSDPGWDVVLATYVAEAEGRPFDLESVAGVLGQPRAVCDRWMKALLQHGVLEIEYRAPRADTPKSFRLTAQTHRKLEDYLGRNQPRVNWRTATA